MRNLKKYLAVVLAVAMLVTFSAPVALFADNHDYAAEAQTLYDLGLYKGRSADSYDPDLESTLTRQEGAIMVLRIFGLEEAALEMDEFEARNLLATKFSDADEVADWAVKQVAMATETRVIAGFPDGRFAPEGNLTGRQFITLVLRQMGYEVPEYSRVGEQFTEIAGLNVAEELSFDVNEAVERAILVGISYKALTTPLADGSGTLAEKLVDMGVISEEAAVENGLVEEEEVEEPVLSVGSVNVTTDEETGLTTVSAMVSNNEDEMATLTLSPDASLEADDVVVEDLAIEEGSVSYEFAEALPAGTHTVTITVGEASDSAIFTIEEPVIIQEVLEVKLVAEDKIAVVFASEVEDTSVVKFVVTGDRTINPTISWNEEKTEAHLTNNVRLAEGDYTVTVEGLEIAEGKNSGSVEVTENGVAKIEIVSEQIIRIDDNIGEVDFKLFDLYGNDITEDAYDEVTFKTNEGKVVEDKADEGILIISLEDEADDWDDFDDEDLVKIEIEADEKVGGNYADAEKRLTISEEFEVDVVTIGEVVFATGESALYLGKGEAGYVVMSAVDQFGRPVTDEKFFEYDRGVEGADFRLKDFDTTPSHDLEDGIYVREVTNDQNEDELRIYFDLSAAIVVDEPDNAEVVEFSVTSETGNESNIVLLDIKQEGTPYEITLGSLDGELAEGDTFEDLFVIPMTVKDKDGNVLSKEEVADKDDLINSTLNADALALGIKVATTGEHKGNLVAKSADADAFEYEDEFDIEVGVEDSDADDAEMTIKVSKRAESERVLFAQEPVSRLVYGADTEFSLDFEDQYGRIMEDEMLDLNQDAKETMVELTITNEDAATLYVNGVKKADENAGTSYVVTVKASELTADDSLKIVAGSEDADFTFTAEASTSSKKLAKSFEVIEAKDSYTYSIEVIPTLYANQSADDVDFADDYAYEIEVKGKDANGNEISVPTAYIGAAASDDEDIAVIEYDADEDEYKVVALNDTLDDEAVSDETNETTIYVTVKGQRLSATVSISEEAPKAEELMFIDTSLDESDDSRELPEDYEVVTGLDADELAGGDNEETVYLVRLDQYGVYTEVDNDQTLQISDLENVEDDTVIKYIDNTIKITAGDVLAGEAVDVSYSESATTTSLEIQN
jgi:hypothetical protein